jgi:uncharacterized repeat protein (TIGR03803 family)
MHKRFLRIAVISLAMVGAALALTSSAWAQSTYKVLHAFKGGNDGSRPVGGVIFDPAGNLYGTTNLGGAYGDGTVFKLTPNSDGRWTKTTIHNFRGKDGANPNNVELVIDAEGNLYGTTSTGGRGNCNGEGCGLVFELTPTRVGIGWQERVLHFFSGNVGVSPQCSLVFDSAGNLYGTTSDWSGGFTGPGTVFKLTPNPDGSWTKTTFFTFDGTDGENPSDGMVFDPAGNLYGATDWGGGNGDGVVYQLTPNGDGTWSENVLYSFLGGENGYRAQVRPVRDSSGNLYGQTTFGGLGYGLIWRVAPNGDGSWTESTLYTFKGGRDGADPWGTSLGLDAAGNLWGTTNEGGKYGCGVLFKLTPTAQGPWTESVVHAFAGDPACGSYTDVLFDAAGNIYGTSSGDGTTTFGSVFEVTP